jgi:hypothetical protein
MEKKSEAEILAEVRQTFADNIVALEAALAGDTTGWIYWYKSYKMGLKITGDKAQVCRVDMATVNPPRLTGGRVWKNGAGVQAETVARVYALKLALSHAREIQATFEAGLAKRTTSEERAAFDSIIAKREVKPI